MAQNYRAVLEEIRDVLESDGDNEDVLAEITRLVSEALADDKGWRERVKFGKI